MTVVVVKRLWTFSWVFYSYKCKYRLWSFLWYSILSNKFQLTHTHMQDSIFSWWWSIMTWSSGLWHHVVMW
jgi:hypothetical protein